MALNEYRFEAVTNKFSILNISSYVIKKIPFFESLVSATSITETKECVDLDISPRFLSIIIDFVVNDQSIVHLKKMLAEYDDSTITKWLMYLGMKQLITKL